MTRSTPRGLGALTLLGLALIGVSFSAIAGSGGWIPAAVIRLDHAGRVEKLGSTVNMPKRLVITDPVLALAGLWLGETVTVDARVILGAVVKIVGEAGEAAKRHAALVDREKKRGDGH